MPVTTGHEIGAMLKLVSDVVFQTNILALNAAEARALEDRVLQLWR